MLYLLSAIAVLIETDFFLSYLDWEAWRQLPVDKLPQLAKVLELGRNDLQHRHQHFNLQAKSAFLGSVSV